MKNTNIQEINIQTVSPNQNIPAGQIVLINVNKNRNSLLNQEPLSKVDDELKDVDHFTKTKNTFIYCENNTDIKHEQLYKLTDEKPTNIAIQKVELVNNKNEMNNITPQTNYQINENKQQTNNYLININQTDKKLNEKKTQVDKSNQSVKKSAINLNHHYEQPDILLSKLSVTKMNDKKDNIAYEIVDGRLTGSKVRTTNTPHYEKPITIKRDVNMSLNTTTMKSQLLDDIEVNQIESFYRSQRTYVFASRSMVNLYFTQTDLVNNGRYSSPRAHEWTLSRTGVPLIIFNKGKTKCRLKRQLRFALAERGSGFQLFSDVIDNLTDYKKMHDSFHTFYLSCDHRKMAGLSFDCDKSADEFLKQIELITSNPKNISLTGPKFYSKKSFINSKNHLKKFKKSHKNSVEKYKKSDISMPCLFQHITNLDINDFEKFFSLSTLVVRALNLNYKKLSDVQNQESTNFSINSSKLSIENISENLTKCDANKQVYKQYLPSSICSYSLSSSPTLPGSSCSYTSSNDDHS